MILKATLGWGSQKASIASAHPSADRGSFQISFIPILARMQQAAQVSSILTVKYHHLFQKRRMRYVTRFGWTLLQDNVWFLDSDSKNNAFTSCFQSLGVFTPNFFFICNPSKLLYSPISTIPTKRHVWAFEWLFQWLDSLAVLLLIIYDFSYANFLWSLNPVNIQRAEGKFPLAIRFYLATHKSKNECGLKCWSHEPNQTSLQVLAQAFA